MKALLPSLMFVVVTSALAAQETSRDFRWEGAVAAGKWVKVQNINGDVDVVAATGDRVEVTAVKRGRGDPEAVRIEVTRYGSNDENVLICAIWDEGTCDETGYHSDRKRNRHDDDDDDVEVEFTVRVPRGVNVSLGTINGSVDVRGVTGEVKASSVNGGVEAVSDGGPVTATTVNGSIRASMRSVGDGELEFTTVNGSITVELPANVDADLRLNTLNGSISSRDFPLSVRGTFSPQSLRATIGKGGTRLSFSTVNGNVELRKRV